ncbi:MAG: TauD/TfdA family dioxygenase [Pseudomonadota bacterium]
MSNTVLQSTVTIPAARRINACLGIELEGVDLAGAAPDLAQQVDQLLSEHGAVLIRDQKLEPADLVRFSRFLGDLDEAPVNEKGKTAVDGLPEVYVVSNIADEKGEPVGSLGNGEAAWHTDMSYLDNPPRASMLCAVEIPSEGGDTWLAGMEAALAAMPGDLRARIDGRRIKHDGTFNSAGLLRQGVTASDDPRECPGTLHPAICRHPHTGREVLYLGRRRNAYVEGLSLADSEALLDDLWAFATRPEFTYAHQWRVGDVLMWDNRATLHRRDSFDPSARRYMLRTQIKGPGTPAD